MGGGQILSWLPSSFRAPKSTILMLFRVTRVNKIETLYGRSRVYVEVELRSNFTFTCGLSYIASISFTNVHFTYIRTENYATVEINLYALKERVRTL